MQEFMGKALKARGVFEYKMTNLPMPKGPKAVTGQDSHMCFGVGVICSIFFIMLVVGIFQRVGGLGESTRCFWS